MRWLKDTIANGKAGTKAQCLKKATEALKDGINVLIDRCNLEREQRDEFLKLYGPKVDVHAVVLDLPASLCISRSVKRTGHEGGLQGGRAAAVVNRMLKYKDVPKLSEGFSRITFCQNEKDVENALSTYGSLGLSDSLLHGCFGQRNAESKVQLGIMKFLKKAEAPINSQENATQKHSLTTDPEKPILLKGDENVDVTNNKGFLRFVPSMDGVPQNRESVGKEVCHTSELDNPNSSVGNVNMDVTDNEGLLEYAPSMDDATQSKESGGKEICHTHELEEPISSVRDVDMSTINNKGLMEFASMDFVTQNDAFYTLVFPSISTSDFQFNKEKASGIIVEEVSKFLDWAENVRLVLVDLTKTSTILSMVESKAVEKGIDPKKFFTFVGDITRLCTDGGLQCNVIANAANWRLRPGGGGVNAAIFSAAGKEFEIATKESATSLNPGEAIAVPLPHNSPLYKREGMTYVIHVLGPNMNPQRPNYLNNDYVEGCRVLCKTYSSLFKCFASLIKTQKLQIRSSDLIKRETLESSNGTGKIPLDQFLQASNSHKQRAKRESCCETESNKKCKGVPSSGFVLVNGGLHIKVPENSNHGRSHHTISGLSENIGSPSRSMAEENKEHKTSKNDRVAKAWSSWAQTLHQIAMHPERHKNSVLESSDSNVVINDLYPKAQKHLLVLVRLDGLDGLADVRKENLHLLRDMHSVGLKWVQNFWHDDASLVFRLGYHSAPSMRQLHLHVISQDFDSPHLKNKKHWNSFNTIFFRDSGDVIEEVDKNGRAALYEAESILSMELRCHRCKSAHPNVPCLKSHIRGCRAPFPASLINQGLLITTPMVARKEETG
ncbi:transcription factor bHLH140 isoform X2 [Amborella trichopoda]|uniref:transcription factor bHLH140 isoform X2 n=1 Tax=Amborella trichopoda TaxID=13333 RepID=UPI0009C07BAA|nr:transcription factor bHLH140 isoform X2 [Amborella trichopoda]|eukprot:XP_020529579.1 transcription factor bHLH140 isoform X2 [Amborella trichopoda]